MTSKSASLISKAILNVQHTTNKSILWTEFVSKIVLCLNNIFTSNIRTCANFVVQKSKKAQ